MQAEAIKLNFGSSPLHLGRGSDELDKSELVYHSDSLKSAIYAVGREIFSEWQDPDYFFHGFKISSCFPFSGEEYFLPRPNIRKAIGIKGMADDLVAKKVKKIGFISLKVFEQFIDQGCTEIIITRDQLTDDQGYVCEHPETCLRVINGIKQKISFFRTEVQQRVKVPSPDSEEDSKPFYIDRIYFEQDCGLYFLAEFKTPEIREQVLHALSILGDRGIGTDRTVGNGLFFFNPETDCKAVQLNTGSKTNQLFIPLGLYLPTESEVAATNLPSSSWSLIKRGGFMGGSSEEQHRHLRKKSIYMFGEGSVFVSNSELFGKYVDLRPDWDMPLHPVWRCGMPLFLNV